MNSCPRRIIEEDVCFSSRQEGSRRGYSFELEQKVEFDPMYYILVVFDLMYYILVVFDLIYYILVVFDPMYYVLVVFDPVC
jgi:hypothetical protein